MHNKHAVNRCLIAFWMLLPWATTAAVPPPPLVRSVLTTNLPAFGNAGQALFRTANSPFLGWSNINVSGGDAVWTNDGTFIYPSGSWVVDTNGTSSNTPPFSFRPDVGSLYIGKYVGYDVNMLEKDFIRIPYVISIYGSNEPRSVGCSWFVADSQDYNAEGAISGFVRTNLANFSVRYYDNHNAGRGVTINAVGTTSSDNNLEEVLYVENAGKHVMEINSIGSLILFTNTFGYGATNIERGSFVIWNSNGFGLWASWNTNGSVMNQQLAPIVNSNFIVSTHGNVNVTNKLGVGTNIPQSRFHVTYDNSVFNGIQWGSTNRPQQGTVSTNGVLRVDPGGGLNQLGVYAELDMTATNIVVCAGASEVYTNVAGTGFGSMITNGFYGLATQGTLTNLYAGYYRITICMSYLGANSTTYEGAFFTNAVEVERCAFKNTTDNPARMRTSSKTSTVYIPAGTRCSFKVQDFGSGTSVAIHRASLTIGTP